MIAAPHFTSLVESLPSTIPFVGPETLERRLGEAFRVRVGANESAFGISPSAAEAMREAIANISWYNDPEGYELRSAIASLHGVSIDEVLLGAGIDEMLGNAVRMVVEPGMPVVTSLGAYPTFNYHAAGFGGVLEAVPYRDDRIDLEALLDAVRRLGAPLVFLANPDNPMGTWHDAAEVRAFIDELPESALLVLDEAYIDFAPASAVFPIEADDPRVIRMRTFSKAHGMAGARVGYAIAPARTIGGLGRIRNHFGVNRIAQAGALASLGDTGVHRLRGRGGRARAQRVLRARPAARALDRAVRDELRRHRHGRRRRPGPRGPGKTPGRGGVRAHARRRPARPLHPGDGGDGGGAGALRGNLRGCARRIGRNRPVPEDLHRDGAPVV